MKMIYGLSMLLVVFLASCSQAKKQQDPVTLLKAKMEGFKRIEEELRKAKAGMIIEWANISYDVRKSDSMVSPYAGTVTGKHRLVINGKPTYESNFMVTLAFQDDAWVVKNISGTTKDIALAGVMDVADQPLDHNVRDLVSTIFR